MSKKLISSVTDIKYCLYINLLSRTDRKQHIEDQLTSIGIQPTRFNAVKLKNGRIGCSMSHLKCLEIAKKNNWPYVMICEDDLLILNKDSFTNHLNNFFTLHGDADDVWNVLLLAGNNVPPYVKIDDTCIQVSHCQTTTGYIIKQSYYDTLITNIRDGIYNLMKNPEKHVKYAIDKYWIQLQKIHPWYMIVPIEAVQREDYSDIEQRQTNYENVMKDVDKHALMRNLYINNSFIAPEFINNVNTSVPNSNQVSNYKTNTIRASNYRTNFNQSYNYRTNSNKIYRYKTNYYNSRYSNSPSYGSHSKPTQHKHTLRVYSYHPSRRRNYGFVISRHRTRKIAYR
jgi:GR25 family glycosyltransferase involved in LPS biosynthesis